MKSMCVVKEGCEHFHLWLSTAGRPVLLTRLFRSLPTSLLLQDEENKIAV